MVMKFVVKKVANMVFIVTDCGTIFKTWHESDFTERKLKNAMNKIQKECYGMAIFDIRL